jgi:hypothetical protein
MSPAKMCTVLRDTDMAPTLRTYPHQCFSKTDFFVASLAVALTRTWSWTWSLGSVTVELGDRAENEPRTCNPPDLEGGVDQFLADYRRASACDESDARHLHPQLDSACLRRECGVMGPNVTLPLNPKSKGDDDDLQ